MNGVKAFKNMSVSNRIFYLVSTLFWIAIMFITVYPLYLVLISSVSDPNALALGQVTWRPINVDFIGYKVIMQNDELWGSYLNSIIYVTAHVILSIFVTMTAAYATSRKDYVGRGVVNMYFVITMFISGGMIPAFLNIKKLGLYDTRAVLIILGCVSVWNMMLGRTFIRSSIPEELYEAAVLDGASHFQYFFKVVMPLSKTIVAVIAVYSAVSKWNGYWEGLIYIKDRAKLPLQNILREILATMQASTDALAMDELDSIAAMDMVYALRIAAVSKYCIIVVSTVPVVILYMLMQKYFEKGVMIGSLKG